MGRRQHISKVRVVDAALTILDAEGVTGLSLERIANELGVRGPSLYYHYTDKSAILRAVARRVVGDLDVLRPTDDWAEWLVENALQFHARVMAHPHVASLLMEHLSRRAVLTGFGRGAELLAAAELDRPLQLQLLEGVQHLTWGFTLHRAVAASNGTDPLEDTGGDWPDLAAARAVAPWADDGAALERMVRAFLHGTMTAAAATGPAAGGPAPDDDPKTRSDR